MTADAPRAARSGADPFAGKCEMAALMREIDWARTPFGPVPTWPQSLRTSVSICLGTSFPMMIAWGAELLMLYNDGFRPVLGTSKHPRAVGQPLLEAFVEVREIVEPMFRGVMASGEAVGAMDMLFSLDRHGYLEETYFLFSYSPIRDESGQVGGVLTTCTETTDRVIGARRLRTLRALAEVAAHATTTEDAFSLAARTLDPADTPFALFYAVDPSGDSAQLVATTGVARDAPAAVDRISLDEADAPWPLGFRTERREARPVDDLLERFGPLSGGPWPEPSSRALVLPIERPGQPHPYGFLVAGISPRRALDDAYSGYLELVADHVATAVSNAQAREEERRRAEKLAELDRAKTTFFSNVSHEFRTPLTLMLGPTEDLLAGVHGELAHEQRTQLELLRRNGLRLHRLVNALLEFSRLEAGRMQAWFEPVDLTNLTRQIASAFQSAIERAGVTFDVACSDLPEPAYVDPELWEQILLNLLSNALKFTFEGAIAVRLTAEVGRFRLEVSDSGVGIPADDLPRLFDRFHRIEGTRARTHEGSGIGLALVRELVGLHGGEISARSTFGRGSTFTVTIPEGSAHLPAERVRPRPAREALLARAAPFVEEALRWLPDEPRHPRAASANSAARGDAANACPASDVCVLLADDNADMRDYLSRILGEHWGVVAVADGQAALAAARHRRPDLLVSDVMMPMLDGFGLLREIRRDARLKSIPVILLSARSGDEACASGIEAGADDYLVKPFSARELLARVRTHLELARARVEHDRQWREWLAMLEHAPFAISLVRMPERRYEFVNDAHVAAAGRNLMGLTLEQAYGDLPDAALDELRRRQDEVFEAAGTVLLPNYAWTLPDGTERHYSAAARCWRGADGSRRGIITVSVDITDQVLAREQSRESSEQMKHSDLELRRALALREEFLTVASHELRTPLTTLGLQAEALARSIQEAPRNDPPIDRWASKVERLRSQAARLGHLIEGMIDVAGLDGTGFHLEPEPCDLGRIVGAVVERFRAESRQARRTLQLATEPVPGSWDPKRVDQLVTQLISNALKFGGDEPIEVVASANQGTARITVRDRGIGIAPEDHARIFGRFERAAPSEHFGGLGVGLWIASELASAMGGEVRVESRQGQGATFSVELPRRT